VALMRLGAFVRLGFSSHVTNSVPAIPAPISRRKPLTGPQSPDEDSG
jgi:hypothetical protein